MTSMFDGMAGLLNDILGGSVMLTQGLAAPVEIQAVFREDPIEVTGDDGHLILISSPSVRVQQPIAESIVRGNVIDPGNGKAYKVLGGLPTGSPASDRFWVFELERVTP